MFLQFVILKTAKKNCAAPHHCLCVSTGVFRSLQQSYSISSLDVLMAIDYCEESLQEIDVTVFLQTLCGHVRVFREDSQGGPAWAACSSKASHSPPTFLIGEEERLEDRAARVSSSR